MAESWYPRISEAMHFLPMLRMLLVRTVAHRLLPSPPMLELWPLVEDGLFGYEFNADRQPRTYVVIGRTKQGTPVVRTSLYRADAPSALRLATRNGIALPPLQARRGIAQQRETCFDNWHAAAVAAWMATGDAFPGEPRQRVKLETATQRSLESALSIAYSHVAKWDPFIHFCGLPQEAQRGFVLSGATRCEVGELIFQRPDIWMLRWKAPPEAVYESWSVVIPDASSDLTRRDS
jgi:hypothetical protein